MAAQPMAHTAGAGVQRIHHPALEGDSGRRREPAGEACRLRAVLLSAGGECGAQPPLHAHRGAGQRPGKNHAGLRYVARCRRCGAGDSLGLRTDSGGDGTVAPAGREPGLLRPERELGGGDCGRGLPFYFGPMECGASWGGDTARSGLGADLADGAHPAFRIRPVVERNRGAIAGRPAPSGRQEEADAEAAEGSREGRGSVSGKPNGMPD